MPISLTAVWVVVSGNQAETLVGVYGEALTPSDH